MNDQKKLIFACVDVSLKIRRKEEFFKQIKKIESYDGNAVLKVEPEIKEVLVATDGSHHGRAVASGCFTTFYAKPTLNKGSYEKSLSKFSFYL